MQIEHVVVLGMHGVPPGPLAEAVALVWPQAVLDVSDGFNPAPGGFASERTLFVLVDPTPAFATDFAAAVDASGLPRWPVLVVAEEKPFPGADWMGPAEVSAPALARALADVTEKHALRRENARLKGDLLTIARRVNHDLRSSLNGVVTAGEVIKEVLLSDRPEDLELVQPVADSAAEISRLIDQVSFVARATAADAVFQELPMDELMWRGLSRVERRIRELDAEVSHGENWPVVRGVGPWIETIWTHLLSNALEHSGGRPVIALGWREEEAVHRFWVEDRGPGVPPEKRAALFTPFHRLAGSGAPKGFGLSIVQRLLELQGGGHGHEVREGGGARFYFTLRKMPAR